MPKSATVTYAYDHGTVTIRLDRIEAIVLKPKTERGGNGHAVSSDPWLLRIDTTTNHYSISFEDKAAAQDELNRLRTLINRETYRTSLVEVAQ